MHEKTLVIILAETRSYGTTYERFKKNFLDVFGADLALCVADSLRENKGNPFYELAKYKWISPEYEDWGDGMECLMTGLDSQWRDFDQLPHQWMGGIVSPNQHSGSAGILLYFREFLKQCLLRDNVLAEYQRIILTRSDYVYETPHIPPEYLNNKYIWIPNGEMYNGYTDRHIICPAKHFIKLISVSEVFQLDPKIEVPFMIERFERYNLERLLKRHYERCFPSKLIRKFPYTMYTVREPDGESRWSMGSYHDSLGVFVKYDWEYKRQRLAKFILGSGAWNKRKIVLFNCSFKVAIWLRDFKRMILGKQPLIDQESI